MNVVMSPPAPDPCLFRSQASVIPHHALGHRFGRPLQARTGRVGVLAGLGGAASLHGDASFLQQSVKGRGPAEGYSKSSQSGESSHHLV